MIESIVTVASIPAILALVNLAKQFGVAGKWAALLSVVLGIGLQVADATLAVDAVLTPQTIYSAAATGLVLGLSAAGLYDVAATIGAKATEPVVEDFAEPELDDEPEEYTPEHAA